MEKIKIAVIGTGIIGRSHLEAIDKSTDCELCAVCDINEQLAKALGEQYNVPYFTDYQEVASGGKADAVILNLPHWIHCEVTEFFLNAGMHVLVEKPMANTVEECERMLDVAKKSGKHLAVGHVQRYFLANQMVKDICDSGELGKLCMYEEYRSINYFDENRPKWFLNKKQSGGGIVMNYGAHALDKLFYILESKPTMIKAAVDNVKNDEEIEGHAQIFMKFENGVSASATFCGYVRSGYEVRYYFTDGILKVVDGVRLFKKTGAEWQELENLEDGNAMSRQLKAFCRLIQGLDTDIPSGEYGKGILEAIECIYKKEV